MAVAPPSRSPGRRNPDRCPYRRLLGSALEAEEDPGAVCEFLEQLTGIGDGSRCRVGLDACQACCLEPEPAGERINSVIASFLFGLTVDVPPRPGDPSWNPDRVKRFQELALAYLERIEAPSPAQPSRVPAYAGPCFYLGPECGRIECSGCRGRVLLKEFLCSHPCHDRTTIQACRSCQDYDPPLVRGSVRTWAVAVTTAPRKSPTLAATLDSLRRAGWKDFLVFAEPGSKLPRLFSRSRLTARREVLGAWGNWLLAASELVVLQPHADAYLICQDDAVFCRRLRDYLETHLWPTERLGVVSLHTPRHHTGAVPGFFPFDAGWGAWGAMAYVFPNASLRALLADARVVNHRNRGPGDGLRNVDSVVGQWCRRRGLPYILHTPSLCEHTGATSTLWKDSTLQGRRSSADFPGEDFDARTLSNTFASAVPDSPAQDVPPSRPAEPAPAPGDRSEFAYILHWPEKNAPDCVDCLTQLLRTPDEVLIVASSKADLPAPAQRWTCVAQEPGESAETAIRDFLFACTSAWIVMPASPAALPADAPERVERLLQGAGLTHGYLEIDPEETGGALPPLTVLRRDAAIELCLHEDAGLLEDPARACCRLKDLGWRDAALAQSPAGRDALPLRHAWREYSLTVVTVLIGRRNCFPDWFDWLKSETFPTQTHLTLVDNSADPEFGSLIRDAASQLLSEDRFAGLSLLRGPGPFLEGPRLNLRRCLNFAHALNLALPAVRGDLALTIDCDVIPQPGSVRLLIEAYTARVQSGTRPGVVSGLCESATYPGHIVAARSRTAWRDIPAVDEIGPGDLVEAGFAGNGCCLMPVAAMRAALPMRAEALAGGAIAGPDQVLCRTLREHGYTVWLHGSVPCRHLFNA